MPSDAGAERCGGTAYYYFFGGVIRSPLLHSSLARKLIIEAKTAKCSDCVLFTDIEPKVYIVYVPT